VRCCTPNLGEVGIGVELKVGEVELRRGESVKERRLGLNNMIGFLPRQLFLVGSVPGSTSGFVGVVGEDEPERGEEGATVPVLEDLDDLDDLELEEVFLDTIVATSTGLENGKSAPKNY
jgi:hypothetical protein